MGKITLLWLSGSHGISKDRRYMPRSDGMKQRLIVSSKLAEILGGSLQELVSVRRLACRTVATGL